MLNLLKSKILPAAFAVLTTFVPAHAAVLDVSDDGQLLGASNVDVNGSLFDVSLITSSTCEDLFDGCDEQGDFTFNNFEDALDAGNALLNQVFIGIFDTQPELTTSDSRVSLAGFSNFVIPFQLREFDILVDAVFVINSDQIPNIGALDGDGTEVGFIFPGLNPDSDFLNNFAVFTAADSGIDTTVDVPSPATFGLFTLGLLGLGLRRKLNQ